MLILAVSDIKLPTKIKSCDRPKGATLTTIELPPQKKGLCKPVAFKLKHYLDSRATKYNHLVVNKSFNCPKCQKIKLYYTKRRDKHLSGTHSYGNS